MTDPERVVGGPRARPRNGLDEAFNGKATHGLGLADLAPSTDLILCDVWGVIHNGVEHHPSAVDALCRFRAKGGGVILVTNAPAPATQVQSRMDHLGVSRNAYDAIATSGDVTTDMIVKAGLPPLFVIGPSHDVALLERTAAVGGGSLKRATLAEAELAVCVGLDERRVRPEDYDEDLLALRERNLTLICANPDVVVQVGDQLIFCGGAIAERYAAMDGRVVQAGKPFPPIYDRARILAAKAGIEASPERTLAIGDAMATDIQGALDQGIRSVFITSGIHHASIHKGGSLDTYRSEDFARFAEAYAFHPDAVMHHLAWTSHSD